MADWRRKFTREFKVAAAFGPETRFVASSSAVSGSSGAYARRQACIRSIVSMRRKYRRAKGVADNVCRRS